MSVETGPARPLVTVTIGQLDVGSDRAANLAAASAAIRTAAADGSSLVVLPEYSSEYHARGMGPEHAEPLDGPWVTGLREAALSNGVAVIAGVVVPAVPGETSEGPRALNLVVAIGPDGELLGTYAKVHLYDAFGFRESDGLAAGDPAAPPLVVELAGLRLGVLTCYDLRFPESARRLVDAGADAIVVPAAWVDGPGKAAQWRALAVARAIENTVFVLAVGQAGAGRTGRSVVVDPDGEVLAELGPEARTASVELDPAVVEETRARNPALALRRYDIVPRGSSRAPREG